MIAVVVVRDGQLPGGADEAVAEAGGRAVVVGGQVAAAVEDLSTGRQVVAWEAGAFRPNAWARSLAPHLAREDVVVLPASADGRDLAPHLAVRLGRPLLAGAVELAPGRAVVPRFEEQVAEEVSVNGPYVGTLLAGVRGVRSDERVEAQVNVLTLAVGEAADAEVLGVTPPDPGTMDLSEAGRIVGGGAGLGSEEAFEALAEVGSAIGASVGGTRVVTDAGWLPFDRQIGTTGVSVSPKLYLAFAISGATQHTAGLGHPDHVISVNQDPSCPMMAMADVAIVSDARAVVDELRARLRERLGVHV